MALFAALSRFAPALNGFSHADVRETVQALLNVSPEDYTASQMGYDLRRLRRTLPDQVTSKSFVVFLTSTLDHPRVQLRHTVTRQALMTAGVNTDVIATRGQSALAQMLSTVHYGDYVSGYLGLLNQVAPRRFPPLWN